MAATNSAFRTETRDEHLYNHIELFNRSSSPIDAPAANRYQDCREQQPTEKQIATGRRMFSDYRTEPNNEHLYYNIQSINNSPAAESQAANQTSLDDRRGQQPTGTSKTMGRRVLFAMMAVLALVFLAMFGSLIARTWVQAAQSGTNGQRIKEMGTDATNGKQSGFQNKVVNKLDQVLREITESKENQARNVCKVLQLASEFKKWATRNNQAEGSWIKVNNSPMCFGAEDNNFDSFFVPSSGKLELVKLVRLNGNVTCDNTHWSFWGCGGNLQDVNVVIKTLADSIILPSREFFTSGEQKESLRIPGYNSFSPKLVLSAVSNPPHVTGGQKLRLWYGQNSRNNTEAKKGGRSCCDVYVRLM